MQRASWAVILFAARGGAKPNPAIRASTGRCAQKTSASSARVWVQREHQWNLGAILGAVALGAGRRAGWHWSESMHAHSNPAGQGPLGFESTKTRTAQPCKKPRVIRPRATGTSAIIVTIEGKARAGVAARRVRASGALPTGDVDGSRRATTFTPSSRAATT